MLCLLGDTCVWLDLAKDANGGRLIAACRQLLTEGRLELLVPQIVIDEFERNRDRIEADMTRSVSATFHRVRAAVDEHGQGDGVEEALKQLDDVAHRMPLINQMAIGQFSEILELLQGGRQLEPSAEVYRRAADRGLHKQAPFHRSKNSVADALIVEMYGEVLAADASGADDHCFVTSNVKDFSLVNGDTRLPHTLLIQGLGFGLRFARLVRDLDEPGPVRCIIGANDTNATFRFHQIREDEHWNDPDLDRYKLDKMIVIDIVPSVR